MKTTNDIFKGSDASLTEVVILPVGSHGAGSYSLPAGDMWTDYESVEMSLVRVNTNETLGSGKITKEAIANNPTDFLLRVVSLNSTTNWFGEITATGVSTFDISQLEGTSLAVKQIKAYKKKYTTRNLSKVVSVNGGSNIAVDSRYEIDIATMLGSEYLNRDLIVEVEIYAVGANYTGWAKSGGIDLVQDGTYNSSGVDVFNDGSIITVYTGSLYLTHGQKPNPWTVTITSAPCRIKVWKVDEYLPATRSSGDITTIWTGSAGNAVTVDWSGSGYVLSQFDDIKVLGICNTILGAGMAPPSILLTEGDLWVASRTTSDTYVNNITETSLVAIIAGGGSITGIYGINYS